jgi:hypothetical protein
MPVPQFIPAARQNIFRLNPYHTRFGLRRRSFINDFRRRLDHDGSLIRRRCFHNDRGRRGKVGVKRASAED